MKAEEVEWAKGLNWLAIGTHAVKLFDATVLAIFAERAQRLKDGPASVDDTSAPIAVSSNIAVRALLEFFESNSANNPLRHVEHAAAGALAQLAESNARAVPVIGNGVIADAVMDALDAEAPISPGDLTPEETVDLMREIYDNMPPSTYTKPLQWRGVSAGVLAYIINEIVRRRSSIVVP